MPASAPLIALIGADGSGKSTLLGDVLAHVRKHGPAEAGYLGLGSGPLGQRIKAWPLIGVPLERFLSERARRARDPEGQIPGIFTALVLYRYSLKRHKRWAHIQALRQQGVAVVADRYPQIEVPGFYDGPGLSAAHTSNPLILWLAARERALYQLMAAQLPTLVLRLNISMETALARKPDHEPDLLARKIAVTPRLTFNGAHIVEIDANRPYDDVLAAVTQAIDKALGDS
jgi:thymidylate kinase